MKGVYYIVAIVLAIIGGTTFAFKKNLFSNEFYVRVNFYLNKSELTDLAMEIISQKYWSVNWNSRNTSLTGTTDGSYSELDAEKDQINCKKPDNSEPVLVRNEDGDLQPISCKQAESIVELVTKASITRLRGSHNEEKSATIWMFGPENRDGVDSSLYLEYNPYSEKQSNCGEVELNETVGFCHIRLSNDWYIVREWFKNSA